MGRIDLKQLRAAVGRGFKKYGESEQLKLIRINIKHFEKLATRAYRSRDIVGFNALRAKAELWRQAEAKHLAGAA